MRRRATVAVTNHLRRRGSGLYSSMSEVSADDIFSGLFRILGICLCHWSERSLRRRAKWPLPIITYGRFALRYAECVASANVVTYGACGESVIIRIHGCIIRKAMNIHYDCVLCTSKPIGRLLVNFVGKKCVFGRHCMSTRITHSILARAVV